MTIVTIATTLTISPRTSLSSFLKPSEGIKIVLFFSSYMDFP
jgi:hypothetical protein